MLRFFAWLAALSLTAQQPSFDELVDRAVQQSGVWEAPVDPAKFGFSVPQDIKWIVLNIETRVEEKSQGAITTTSSVHVQFGSEQSNHGTRYCGTEVYDPATRHLNLPRDRCGRPFGLAVDVSADGQQVKGTLQSGEKSVPVTFVRLPYHRTLGWPFQGVWTASSPWDDRTVVFRIAYSLVGKPLVTQDFLWKVSVERRIARIGELWQSHFDGQGKLYAIAQRPAFNDTQFTGTVSDGGDALFTDHCGARMGLLCPVTFLRKEASGL